MQFRLLLKNACFEGVLPTDSAEEPLLTGDIVVSNKRQLIAKYAKSLQSDILLVAHHGSKTSSSLEFIRQVNTRYAVAIVIDMGTLKRQ